MNDDYIAREFAALMALPIDNPDRPKLSERVPIKPERLHARCRKFLTLGAVYAERETFRKRMHEKPMTYRDWMISKGISAADATRESERARQEWAEIIARGGS